MPNEVSAARSADQASVIPQRAMVLAAGLGVRMRPITDSLPKPLVEVAGRPMLDHILDRLAGVGVGEVVVNLHHLGHMIRDHLGNRKTPRITFSEEAELLETGGGVKKALPLLGPAPFFAINGDVMWLDGYRSALARLAREWDDERMDALLLFQATPTAIGYAGPGDYFLDRFGAARRRKEREVAPFLFAGIQILHPRLFKNAPEGPFSLRDLYDKAEAAGRLHAIRHDGMWFHIGDAEGLEEANTYLRPQHDDRRT